ncbi:hypothetical protein HYH02_013700 [Chlamydomonas schloesseri]|uniref:Uncharacterized protein n=1 Tax=Chlamydomonas schloesseri TaxID=2026947 RepID=A0A835SPC1_9CHLO|nr:hypothetical protein HYH02_013700 [Chlamydomonas schloesseri]|eukprot:KAG2430704.1 hypothetical protein HYH02_013700 [Chlamydomonas schloesseri]
MRMASNRSQGDEHGKKESAHPVAAAAGGEAGGAAPGDGGGGSSGVGCPQQELVLTMDTSCRWNGVQALEAFYGKERFAGIRAAVYAGPVDQPVAVWDRKTGVLSGHFWGRLTTSNVLRGPQRATPHLRMYGIRQRLRVREGAVLGLLRLDADTGVLVAELLATGAGEATGGGVQSCGKPAAVSGRDSAATTTTATTTSSSGISGSSGPQSSMTMKLGADGGWRGLPALSLTVGDEALERISRTIMRTHRPYAIAIAVVGPDASIATAERFCGSFCKHKYTAGWAGAGYLYIRCGDLTRRLGTGALLLLHRYDGASRTLEVAALRRGGGSSGGGGELAAASVGNDAADGGGAVGDRRRRRRPAGAQEAGAAAGGSLLSATAQPHVGALGRRIRAEAAAPAAALTPAGAGSSRPAAPERLPPRVAAQQQPPGGTATSSSQPPGAEPLMGMATAAAAATTAAAAAASAPIRQQASEQPPAAASPAVLPAVTAATPAARRLHRFLPLWARLQLKGQAARKLHAGRGACARRGGGLGGGSGGGDAEEARPEAAGVAEGAAAAPSAADATAPADAMSQQLQGADRAAADHAKSELLAAMQAEEAARAEVAVAVAKAEAAGVQTAEAAAAYAATLRERASPCRKE